jgi:hypothetical protein
MSELPCTRCRLHFEWYKGVSHPPVLCRSCKEEVEVAAAYKAKREAERQRIGPEKYDQQRAHRREVARCYRQKLDAESRERYYGPFLRDTEIGRAMVAHGETPKYLMARVVNACMCADIKTADDLLRADPRKIPNLGKVTLRYLYDALHLPYPRQLVVSQKREMVEGDL